MPLASEIMDEAAALVGDRLKRLYTYDKQLPYLQRAVRRLTSAMLERGKSTVDESQISSVVNALAITHPSPPNDLLLPTELWERSSTSVLDSDWVKMTERAWDPDESQVDELVVWKWEDEAILFRGALTARKVLLKYQKSLGVVTGSSSPILIINCENYLAAKTGEFIARYVGKNEITANQLQAEAQESLDEFMNARVHEDQDTVVRLKPYSWLHRGGR